MAFTDRHQRIRGRAGRGHGTHQASAPGPTAWDATARSHRLLPVLLTGALLAACAALVPLREPPIGVTDEALAGLTTRAEIVARLGPPLEVSTSDLGAVLVYRRLVIAGANPNRYHGEDRGARLDRYERVLLYLDDTGRLVRWTTRPE